MPPGRKLMEELWRHRSGWKAIEGLWNDAFLNKRRVERLRAARSGPAEPPQPLVIADDGEAPGYEFLTLNLPPATPVADPAPPPPPPVPTPPPPPPPPGPTPPPSPTLPPDAVLRAWRNSSVFTYGKLAAMGLVAAFLLYLFWRRARGWNVGGGDDIGGPDPGEGGGMHGAEVRGLLDALGVVLGQEINDGDGQGGGGNPLLIRRGVPSDLQLQALFLSGGDLGADFLKALSIIDSTCNISVKLVLGMKIKARALERLKIILERDDSSCRDMSLPWLFSLAENGHGMLVPRNAFRQTNYNSAGFQCYKLPEHHLPPGMSLVGVSVTDAGESDEKSALVSWIWSLNKIKLKDVIERCSPKGVFVLRC